MNVLRGALKNSATPTATVLPAAAGQSEEENDPT